MYITVARQATITGTAAKLRVDTKLLASSSSPDPAPSPATDPSASVPPSPSPGVAKKISASSSPVNASIKPGNEFERACLRLGGFAVVEALEPRRGEDEGGWIVETVDAVEPRRRGLNVGVDAAEVVEVVDVEDVREEEEEEAVNEGGEEEEDVDEAEEAARRVRAAKTLSSRGVNV
ncbi:hypothetical protein HK104_005169 [Borealophlyctis nickersoniae]|nr:hypothetical protein HK104_005169 [Borealophlyctis nickersoniae]